ncbi:MAG TPA: HlyD family efflux transporter periplasmic adaptor subunit, partial [Burkholderiales bacterium]|nr:HlyD family efflux transporter periplasmic adaptor subunit [Burkholderiales bacterium]
GGGSLPHQPDYQLAYPIRLDGKVRGVVGLDIQWRQEAQLQHAMRQLQWGSGWLEVLLRRHADPMEAARMRLKLILQFVSVFLDQPRFKDAATALVTEVATQLGCDRVSLGIKRAKGVRIQAVSHATQFDRHSNLLRAAEGAMLEALDQNEPIVYPPDRDGRLAVTFAHAELAQLSGAGGVASLPLVNNERQVGALTLERAPGLRFDAPTIELLEGLASMLGPLVDLQRVQQRSLPSHAADSTKGLVTKLFGPRHGGFKLATLLFAGIVAFLALATGDYRISADTRVEGQVQRAVTAPFSSYVREAHHRAGDIVREGDLLARLDDRDLRLERVRLAAQREQLGKQYREAMAERNRAQVSIISSQIDQADAQIAMLEEQLSRVDIGAPFDGVIVSGDLTQSLGAPLERGQVLYEVAPLDSYRVVLHVDERDIADVQVGQRGELVLSAMPGSGFPFQVEKITPVNTAKEGQNFFRVEAVLGAAGAQRLRPGMEGVGKIYVEERRLIWIWTRQMVNWFKLKAWAWLP